MQKQIEEWRDCQGIARLQVSNLGRVKRDGVLQVLQTKEGYRHVWDGEKDRRVHRLVAAAFCVKPAGCDIVNHLDGSRDNNCADNLEWCTSAQNTAHAKDTGLIARGEDASNSTLTESQVRQIDEALRSDKDITSITKRLSVSYEMVCKIKAGRTWTHVTERTFSPANRDNSTPLTEELVLQIDQRLQAGVSIKAVAAEFNVGYEGVKKIKAGLTWGHITGRGNTQKMTKTKLAEADVRLIRQRVATGEAIRVIAREYGMSHSVIGAVARGETWKHVV